MIERCLQFRTRLGIVFVIGGIMADTPRWDSFEQPSANRLIQSLPVTEFGPVGVSREHTTEWVPACIKSRVTATEANRRTQPAPSEEPKMASACDHDASEVGIQGR